MRRPLMVCFAIAFIVALIVALMAAAYGVAYLAEGWFEGGARLSNILFLMLLFVMVIATLLTVAERKWSAMIQDRIGPHRARIALPFLRDRALGGLPHLPADVLKMLFKEDFKPAGADRLLFNLAPILAFAPSLALLGGVRASSQMISYEVALGLSLVGMMIVFSTVQLPVMTDAQARYLWQAATDFDFGLPAWGIFLQPLGFVLFFAAAFAETKRAPFDVPEGESEIIGYFVEYSGMKFGMFMISEFVEVVVLSGVTAAIFFGGYHLPVGEQWLSRLPLFEEHPWLFGTLLGSVFWIKVVLLCWVQLMIRWTFPRFRYDQIQALGWKRLLPVGLANVFLTGALILWDPSLRALASVGILEIATLLVLTFSRRAPERQSSLAGGTHSSSAHGALPQPAPSAGQR